MTSWVLLATTFCETALIGGIALLYPRIVRRGLLFGVYVGEEVFESEAAKAVARGWDRTMLGAFVACNLLGLALSLVSSNPYAAVVPVHLMLLLFLVLYLRAHFRARLLAPTDPPAPDVARLAETLSPSALLPVLTIVLCVACGAFAIAYASAHYAQLPRMVPTHFSFSGEPDAWRPKSFFTVMLLPALVLVIGVFLGTMTWLTAHAKPALRRSAEEVSLGAQLRFRTATTRYLCGVSILAVGMLAVLSIESIRVGIGEADRLSPALGALGLLVAAYAVGGALYIALRYGQGGARLEKVRRDTPLTNGLADNRKWLLGMLYVNREDPSFLVERRFGIGYTVNFGNPKAVALVVGFVLLVVALAIFAR